MNFPLHIYQESELKHYLRKRKGETKLGEKVTILHSNNEQNLKEELSKNKSKFVLLGLPEDVGVRANYGRGGAYSAWQPALTSFLSTQSNSFLSGEEILLLGHINFDEAMKAADALNIKKQADVETMRSIVAQIDEKVSTVIQTILEAGKIPIVIGGGHNNAYGCIKGSSLATNKPINVVNSDAHTDFRALEGRHSGNGFSYAFEQNYMQKYSVVGLHESYNSNTIFEAFEKNKSRLHFTTYEQIFIREEIEFKQALKASLDFVKNETCGLEIDLDTIQNIPSSAKTSSGISALQGRQYISYFAKNANICYLHIAEGAPVLSHIKTDNKTGKLIAYLISDFVKAYKD
ncbi:MAG: formimidoylglutamase [Bacteroidota bacterium]